MASARTMLESRAFLHWYERYGCDGDEIHRALETVQGVVDEYRGMNPNIKL